MRNIDNKAVKNYGIPSIVLMENAGRSLAEISQKYLSTKTKTIAVICGSGNNGGDGLVAARYLFNKGIRVKILSAKPAAAFKGDPLINYSIAKKMGIPIAKFKKGCLLNGFGFIIDALLGTGVKGPVSETYKQVIDEINISKLPVLSADIPSGLDADNGTGDPIVKASVTVTMGLIKKGLIKAKPFVGKLVVADIGLPKNLLKVKS
jgi:NAD(P)H-hydrate epimerase